MSTVDQASPTGPPPTGPSPIVPRHVSLPGQPDSATIQKLLQQYGCGPIQFAGADDGLYDRHLLFDGVTNSRSARPRERFEAFARAVRDLLSERWVHTEQTRSE